MPSNHLILCHPLFLPPSIFPSISIFSNESVLHIRWPKYRSFSFSISPSNEYSGLISFRVDWLDLLAVQRTLKSLLQCCSSKASILRRLAFFIVQLSHPYMTTGKTVALTRRTIVGKVMSLRFNMLSSWSQLFFQGASPKSLERSKYTGTTSGKELRSVPTVRSESFWVITYASIYLKWRKKEKRKKLFRENVHCVLKSNENALLLLLNYYISFSMDTHPGLLFGMLFPGRKHMVLNRISQYWAEGLETDRQAKLIIICPWTQHSLCKWCRESYGSREEGKLGEEKGEQLPVQTADWIGTSWKADGGPKCISSTCQVALVHRSIP